MAHSWVLTFHQTDPGDTNWVIGFGKKTFSLLSHLSGPNLDLTEVLTLSFLTFCCQHLEMSPALKLRILETYF